MEEEEIEPWYDAEKERLTSEFLALIEKSKDRERYESEYKKKMRELHKRYEYRMRLCIEEAKAKQAGRLLEFHVKKIFGKFKD